MKLVHCHNPNPSQRNCQFGPRDSSTMAQSGSGSGESDNRASVSVTLPPLLLSVMAAFLLVLDYLLHLSHEYCRILVLFFKAVWGIIRILTNRGLDSQNCSYYKYKVVLKINYWKLIRMFLLEKFSNIFLRTF